MVRFYFSLVLICSILFFQTDSIAEESKLSNSTFGIFANYGMNFHSADFNMLKDIPNCCPDFESGDGTDVGIGLLYEYRLESKFSVGMRLGITNLSGQLSSIEETTVMIDNAPGKGEFEHIMDGKYTALGLTPMLIYNATDRFKVYAGIQYNFILTSTFEQVEKIKTPDNIGTFIDENGDDTFSRTRNEFSGDIPEAKSNSLALTFGVGYELPLNKKNTLRLTPEIFYNYGLSEMVSETSWKISRLEGGLALKYTPSKSKDKPERMKEIHKIDTVKIGNGQYLARVVKGKEMISTDSEEKATEIVNYQYISRIDTAVYQTEMPDDYKGNLADGSDSNLTDENNKSGKDKNLNKIDSKVNLSGLDDNGKPTEDPVFIVEEFVSHKINPLLKYVFFNENSAELDDKYVSLKSTEVDKFSIDSLFKYDIMDIYYNVLNIIGERLIKYPNANITLTGCNANIGKEENNLKLSADRANIVKEYFTSVWNISADRIKIERRNLPQSASLPKTESDKAEENRRVEISSDTPEIVKFVSLNNIERKVNPPKAVIAMNVEAEAKVDSWTITATQENSNRVFTKEGKGTPPQQIIWNFDNTPTAIPTQPKELSVELVATDIYGNKTTSTDKSQPLTVITLDHKETEGIEDYKIDKYRLILFDFNTSSISGENKEIVSEIKKNIKPESSVTVTGHTDRTGNSDYNRALSQRRAESVEKELGHSKSVAKGMGEDNLLYDNDTPEARFYCRTVVVEVKTKK